MYNSPEINNGNFFPDFKPKVDETKAKESVGGKCPTINHAIKYRGVSKLHFQICR